MPSDKPSKGRGGFSLWVILPILLAIVYPILRTRQAADPLHYLIPNLLLFTNQREFVKAYWEKNLKIDKAVIREPMHIAVVDGKDYSFESLRAATENWRYPAVVRGLFNGTAAMEKWVTPEYLPSRLGKYIIPVIREAIVGKVQNDRANIPFADAFGEIVSNEDSRLYLFFPVKSRFSTNGSDIGSLKALEQEVNQIVADDLELHRIWPGFGTKAHKTFVGSQLIIGQGSDDTEQTTGTGWHCAAGNNWFAQVSGAKRWYFMDPKYSAYMHPLRGGKVNMMTGTRLMKDYHRHIPLRYADIRAGDLLYNPDWEWHTIQNYKGLSIGVPIREFNASLSFQNNAHYTSIVLLNKLLEKFNLDIGGYPPATAV